MTKDEFALTLKKIETTDCTGFLLSASAPGWTCPTRSLSVLRVHDLAGGPKRLVWYDEDRHFTSWEAARDRLHWLAQHLAVTDV